MNGSLWSAAAHVSVPDHWPERLRQWPLIEAAARLSGLPRGLMLLALVPAAGPFWSAKGLWRIARTS